MGSTLTNGIYLPAEGERNCYTGLAANWSALDSLIGGYNVHIGNATIHVTAEDKEAWNGKADASALTAHTGDTTIHVTAEDKQAWNGHVADTTIHVTSADKQAWNGKADASALTAHTGDTTIHVTATDKAKWDAVTSKANDSDVVHKSGNETVSGSKTFDSNTYIYNSDNTATTPSLSLKSSKIEISSQGNTSGEQNLLYLDKNNTVYAYVKGAIQSNGSAVKIRSTAKDSSDNSVISELQILAYTNGKKAIFPSYSNEIDLGVSSYKWKSFNGINPGALSLPNLTAGVDISAYITNITGASNINKFTPTADGWISIGLSNADFIEIYIPASLMGATFTKSTTNNTSLAFMPVIANKEVKITLKGSSIGWAKFYPCQGNI